LMVDWDARYFGAAPVMLDRDEIEDAMVAYMQRVQAATGEPWSHVSRHLLGLRNGQSGARRWRQVWSDHRLKGESPARVSAEARAALGVNLSPAEV